MMEPEEVLGHAVQNIAPLHVKAAAGVARNGHCFAGSTVRCPGIQCRQEFCWVDTELSVS
jgi:hypothetical protein